MDKKLKFTKLPLKKIIPITAIIFTILILKGTIAQKTPSTINLRTTAFFSARSPQIRRDNFQYNVTTSPNLKSSYKLQGIVNAIVKLAVNQDLPKNRLSITLIDLKSNAIASYQQNQLRYPASIVKLFWMVAAYAKIHRGVISEPDLKLDISKMIIQSNNESASRVLDKITDTESGIELSGQKYQNWLNNRLQINRFFQQAGYENINISQKTFPVPYINQNLPTGRDLQMRGNQAQAIRNQMTTFHAARALYEIYHQQAISRSASQKMLRLLTRDLQPKSWVKEKTTDIELNPIADLFGEGLPVDVSLVSKAGWTSTVRQEAAIISTKNGSTRYILVVFGNDRTYSNNLKFFPKISRYVFEQMNKFSDTDKHKLVVN